MTELIETIEKKGDKYIIKSEVDATAEELKTHLRGIRIKKESYEEEVERFTNGIPLSKEQQTLKDDLDVIDQYRVLETEKAKVGNVDKRIRELKEAIGVLDKQIKARETLFPEDVEEKPSK